jgi:hypothetical protein
MLTHKSPVQNCRFVSSDSCEENMLSYAEDKVFPGVSQKGNTVQNATAHRVWFTK